jgi:SPP1 gp7 family putative phage head morphogenesis protein
MRYHELPVISRKVEDYEAIEKKIILMLRKSIYVPLMKDLGLGHQSLRNALDDLVDAVFTAQIQYVDGHFEGKFNAQISAEIRKLGGTWDRGRGWWTLADNKFPIEVRAAVGASRSKYEEMARKIDVRLERILPEEAVDQLTLAKIFDGTIYRADTDFQKNVAKVTVSPALTPAARARIASEYSQNLHLYIRDFMDKEILDLRKTVMEVAQSGARYSSMVKGIQDSYGVSLRKARFLARQETSLLMTKFKQVRYTEAGLPEYKWKCVKMPHDSNPRMHVRGNVRYYHGILEGKICRWDRGEIVDGHGHRKNPGQDWECRCNAAPVVRF